jgi:type II secretory pathway component PulK
LKRYLPKNAEDASALILTLLVIVLLSTIVTSFLSSTRTEQTATRNYTSKTQAEMLATRATQQAMAALQSAFNGNGNGTAIVTSQPGAIGKYVACCDSKSH